jgi:hypothetical protein
MSTKYVMKNNRNIGYTKDMGSTVYAHDFDGRNVGYYNASSNTTFDKSGRRYGNGNLTEALVFEEAAKNGR